MRQRATAGGYVCIWTLREKKWPILVSAFFFFFFLTDHTSVRHDLPPPSPAGALAAQWRDATESQSGGSTGQGGGGGAPFSHPRVKLSAVALWAYTLCLSVILRTCTRPGWLQLWDHENKGNVLHNNALQGPTLNLCVWAKTKLLTDGDTWGLMGVRGASCWAASFVLFDWVCLLTSPSVVNCIKAVSGSMAIFYNSYFYRERITK